MKSRIKKGLKLVSNVIFTILVLIVIVMLVYVEYEGKLKKLALTSWYRRIASNELQMV